MGLLDKLWDDTMAGPRPDTGLGRLRKIPTFSIRTDFSKEEAPPAAAEETPKVTRSIMIRRPAGSPTACGTPPESPAGSSTPPVSPFYGSGRREWNRFRRKSMSDAYERNGGGVATAPATPTAAPTAVVGFGSRGRTGVPPFEA